MSFRASASESGALGSGRSPDGAAVPPAPRRTVLPGQQVEPVLGAGGDQDVLGRGLDAPRGEHVPAQHLQQQGVVLVDAVPEGDVQVRRLQGLPQAPGPGQAREVRGVAMRLLVAARPGLAMLAFTSLKLMGLVLVTVWATFPGTVIIYLAVIGWAYAIGSVELGVPTFLPEIMPAVEIGWRLVPNETIAVTGSNGKTTTVELIGHLGRQDDVLGPVFEGALQDWPLLFTRAVTAVAAAWSMSALGMTMNGSDPPSSSTTFFRLRPAISATAAPARSEPVSETPWIRGSAITSAI